MRGAISPSRITASRRCARPDMSQTMMAVRVGSQASFTSITFPDGERDCSCPASKAVSAAGATVSSRDKTSRERRGISIHTTPDTRSIIRAKFSLQDRGGERIPSTRHLPPVRSRVSLRHHVSSLALVRCAAQHLARLWPWRSASLKRSRLRKRSNKFVLPAGPVMRHLLQFSSPKAPPSFLHAAHARSHRFEHHLHRHTKHAHRRPQSHGGWGKARRRDRQSGRVEAAAEGLPAETTCSATAIGRSSPRYPNFDAKDPLYGGWAFVRGVPACGRT